MSRELKFRGWDNKEKKMYYFDLKQYMSYNENGQERLCSCEAKNNLMQYVGFKDKNNKPIYEGDIDELGYVITYLANLNDGLGMEAGWYLQRDNFESWSKLECTEDIEIIGNIFETPQKAINNCNTDYAKIYFRED